jgi:aspartyl-tRNA(Asn)/glutamyl-tRNA(Gln) amidotransferase subunit A
MAVTEEMLELVEVAHLIRTRAISPVEVVEGALRRAEGLNPALNAYITLLSEQALAEARDAEREIARGDYRGPLHGVPLSVKDIFSTRGILTTCGSRVLAAFVPEEDATVVERLRAAGGILVAKANTFQFACSPPHPDFGPTRNPWDLTRTTRGSSSGSAAAVAAGLDYGSYGSDTGGSIRVPAAFSGIVGLKPTYGRISRFGMQPVSWTLDHAGPLGRSVVDVAALFAAVAGPDTRDPNSIDVGSSSSGDRDGLVIGVVSDFMGSDVEPEVLAAVQGAIGVLAGAGLTVKDVAIPELTKDALDAHGQIMWPEAAHCHRDWFPRLAEEYTTFSQRRFTEARAVPTVDYLRGLDERRRIQARVADIQREIDLFVQPTAPMVATPLESMEPDADERAEELTALGAWNSPFNLTGQPALTVPCGFSADGLPIGLQIVGRPGEDELMLHAGAVYQSQTDWHRRHPAIAATVP